MPGAQGAPRGGEAGRICQIEEAALTVGAFWRRLDVPGHDACRLLDRGDGWALDGCAVYREDIGSATICYGVECDRRWQTRRGAVRGWIGARMVELLIERDEVGWLLDGRRVEGLSDCVDLDFGFTPATNLIQLRRTALAIGAVAEVPVAWIDATAGELTRLPQRYQRRSESSWWYQSPTTGYQDLLVVGDGGFVAEYPGLWRAA